MAFAVFITTPRAGMGFVIAPYTVETAKTYPTREKAQEFADAKVMSPAVVALFDAMPPVHPEWLAGFAYAAGAWCSYGGKSWSIIQPHTSQAGWEPPNVPALWQLQETPGVTAWAAGIAYAMPSQRTYAGRTYDLVQAHTSQAGWEPPNVPALWNDIGSALDVPAYSRAQWWVVDTGEPDYANVIRGKEPNGNGR